MRPAAAATRHDTAALSANTKTGRNITTYAANPHTILPAHRQQQPHAQPAPPQAAPPLDPGPPPHLFCWIQPHASRDLLRSTSQDEDQPLGHSATCTDSLQCLARLILIPLSSYSGRARTCMSTWFGFCPISIPKGPGLPF